MVTKIDIWRIPTDTDSGCLVDTHTVNDCDVPRIVEKISSDQCAHARAVGVFGGLIGKGVIYDSAGVCVPA